MWDKKYGAFIWFWESVWDELVLFLGDEIGIRRVLCSLNAIEFVSACYW